MTEQTVQNIQHIQFRTSLHDRQQHEKNLAVSEEGGRRIWFILYFNNAQYFLFCLCRGFSFQAQFLLTPPFLHWLAVSLFACFVFWLAALALSNSFFKGLEASISLSTLRIFLGVRSLLPEAFLTRTGSCSFYVCRFWVPQAWLPIPVHELIIKPFPAGSFSLLNLREICISTAESYVNSRTPFLIKVWNDCLLH